MTNGFFLGGVAKGVESGARQQLERDTLALRGQQVEQQGDLAQRRLSIAESAQERAQENDLLTKATKQVSDNVSNLTKMADALRRQGKTPDDILGVAEPIIQSTSELATQSGQDGNILGERLRAEIQAPQSGSALFKGTGFQAQSANTLIQLSGKVKAGIPLSGQEKAAYSIAFGEATKPKLVKLPDGSFGLTQQTIDETIFPRPESIGASPADNAPGAEAAPTLPQSPGIPSRQSGASVTRLGGTQRQKANDAGRTELVVQGAKNAQTVRDAIVNPDGSVNRDTVFTMVSDVPLLGRGLPGTEGRTVRGQIEDALAAKLRLETGAQANEQEIQNILDRFLPSLMDSDKTITDKMDRLVEFFTGTLKRTDPETFEKLTSRSQEDGTIPQPPASEAGATFEGFDPSSGVAVFKRLDGTSFGIARTR